MDCQEFSCELGKLIMERINPDLKEGDYKIVYNYRDKKTVEVAFISCQEGDA